MVQSAPKKKLSKVYQPSREKIQPEAASAIQKCTQKSRWSAATHSIIVTNIAQNRVRCHLIYRTVSSKSEWTIKIQSVQYHSHLPPLDVACMKSVLWKLTLYGGKNKKYAPNVCSLLICARKIACGVLSVLDPFHASFWLVDHISHGRLKSTQSTNILHRSVCSTHFMHILNILSGKIIWAVEITRFLSLRTDCLSKPLNSKMDSSETDIFTFCLFWKLQRSSSGFRSSGNSDFEWNWLPQRTVGL